MHYNSGNPLNYVIERGDVLIAMSGATTGKIGYYNLDEKAYLNQRVGKLIPNKEILNNRFRYHFILTKSRFIICFGWWWCSAKFKFEQYLKKNSKSLSRH
ncbi:MAG: restriction endonuclease subunit S [Saprospiraceae bacterium]